MLGHYTQAAMVAENRRPCVPASTDSLPTSAMQEDHVSMGWAAARKLRTVLANVGRILGGGAHLRSAALDLRAPLEPAPARALREHPCGDRARPRARPLARAGARGGRGARGVERPARSSGERDREPRMSASRATERRAAPSSRAGAGPRRPRCGC